MIEVTIMRRCQVCEDFVPEDKLVQVTNANSGIPHVMGLCRLCAPDVSTLLEYVTREPHIEGPMDPDYYTFDPETRDKLIDLELSRQHDERTL